MLTRIALSAVILLLCAGCERPGIGDRTTTESFDSRQNRLFPDSVHATVSQIKTAVHGKGGLPIAKLQTEQLLEQIDHLESTSTNDQRDAYVRLHAKAHALKFAFDTSAKPIEISVKVAELVAAVEQHP